MKLQEFRVNFNSQLANLYPATEINSFFFILIEHQLNMQRIDLSLHPEKEISESDISFLKKALSLLKQEMPIQHILGETEFYGYPFNVTKNTLIPRPETEELVDWVIEESTNTTRILDIGTGTGCIPISLAKELKNTVISAIDVSDEALQIAKENAVLNNVSIHFISLDILLAESLPKAYDIFVSNPPYVRNLEKVEINKNVLEYEPHLALFVSDDNPLIFYSKIADLAKNHLTKNGFLFFEINQYLGKETCSMLKEKGFKNIVLKKDFSGNDRMIKANL